MKISGHLLVLFFAVVISLIGFLGILTPHAYAAISNASNTLTTSRPSASSPLTASGLTTDTKVSILNNGSFFLASDSAKIIRTSTGAIIDPGTIVSSQSAALTEVFFAEQLGTTPTAGDDKLIVPVTAMHKIQFTAESGMENGGVITLTYPALATNDANNEASPSASTFQFNNLDADAGSLIQLVIDGVDRTSDALFTASNPTGAGDGGDITITLSTGVIDPGDVVKIFIGCTTVSAGECSAQSPRIINPTKSASAGTADVWEIGIQIDDSQPQQSITVGMGIVESVVLRATVDPTLSFTIASIANGAAVNLGNTTGCSQSELTNAGLASTATEINLGLLANTPSGTDVQVGNMAAQRITISTNAARGYTLTATSSGSLINPATGVFIDSSTTPAAFPSTGADWFGIHPCGLDVTSTGGTDWSENGTQTCSTVIAGSTANECRYGWPTRTSALTLASDSVGPVGNSITPGNGIVSVAYAAGVDAGITAGDYRAIITYVATPTF